MRACAFAIRPHDGCALAKIDLGFLAGSAFHPAERQRRTAIQPAGEPLDGLVIPSETMFISQILPEAPGSQSCAQVPE